MIAAAPAPWPLFEVTFDGRSNIVAARSRGAARYLSFLSLSDVWADLTFGRWVTLISVRKVAALQPGCDPYAYVRRNYDRDLQHGTRVTIRGEGPDLEGKTGTVIHPGRDSTAYAHVVVDGTGHKIIVHPYSVEVLA